MLGNGKSNFELFHIFRVLPYFQVCKIAGNYKGGCLRRPRAARRMLPAASTVRSASPASRARRGFTFIWGNCQPRGRYEKTENVCWLRREPQPYPQQQDVLCSSPSGPAEDPPWNFTGIIHYIQNLSKLCHFMIDLKVSPPRTRVPVAGASLGSSTSMSKLKKFGFKTAK